MCLCSPYFAPRLLELWNIVFMEHEQQDDGSLRPLAVQCIDTGMGLERVAAVLQGKSNNFDIDSFALIVNAALALSGGVSPDPLHRIIADHVRCATFLLADGVLPGYVTYDS